MQPTNHLNEPPTIADVPDGKPAEKQPASGRDTNGRFAKGNLGGPGNPFARQVAGFRKALCAAVTELDITELAQILLLKAKAGDLLAMKLLFQYTLGKPAEATEPDSLDAQEMRLFRQNDVESDTMTDLVYGTPAELAVKVLRVLLPTRAKQIAGAMGEMLRSQADTPREPPPPPPATCEPAEKKRDDERAFSQMMRELRGKKRRRRKLRASRRLEAAALRACPEAVNGTCDLDADDIRCKRRGADHACPPMTNGVTEARPPDELENRCRQGVGTPPTHREVERFWEEVRAELME